MALPVSHNSAEYGNISPTVYYDTPRRLNPVGVFTEHTGGNCEDFANSDNDTVITSNEYLDMAVQPSVSDCSSMLRRTTVAASYGNYEEFDNYDEDDGISRKQLFHCPVSDGEGLQFVPLNNLAAAPTPRLPRQPPRRGRFTGVISRSVCRRVCGVACILLSIVLVALSVAVYLKAGSFRGVLHVVDYTRSEDEAVGASPASLERIMRESCTTIGGNSCMRDLSVLLAEHDYVDVSGHVNYTGLFALAREKILKGQRATLMGTSLYLEYLATLLKLVDTYGETPVKTIFMPVMSEHLVKSLPFCYSPCLYARGDEVITSLLDFLNSTLSEYTSSPSAAVANNEAVLFLILFRGTLAAHREASAISSYYHEEVGAATWRLSCSTRWEGQVITILPDTLNILLHSPLSQFENVARTWMEHRSVYLGFFQESFSRIRAALKEFLRHPEDDFRRDPLKKLPIYLSTELLEVLSDDTLALNDALDINDVRSLFASLSSVCNHASSTIMSCDETLVHEWQRLSNLYAFWYFSLYILGNLVLPCASVGHQSFRTNVLCVRGMTYALDEAKTVYGLTIAERRNPANETVLHPRLNDVLLYLNPFDRSPRESTYLVSITDDHNIIDLRGVYAGPDFSREHCNAGNNGRLTYCSVTNDRTDGLSDFAEAVAHILRRGRSVAYANKTDRVGLRGYRVALKRMREVAELIGRDRALGDYYTYPEFSDCKCPRIPMMAHYLIRIGVVPCSTHNVVNLIKSYVPGEKYADYQRDLGNAQLTRRMFINTGYTRRVMEFRSDTHAIANFLTQLPSFLNTVCMEAVYTSVMDLLNETDSPCSCSLPPDRAE